MADNTTLNSGTGGDTIATDDIAGVKYQRVKVTEGADGTANDVSDANPLPVEISDGTDTALVSAAGAVQVDVASALPAGTNAIGKLAANSGVDIGDVSIADTPSIQDANNTTTTPLGVDGVFTGTSTETLNYKTITIVIFADQNSATDGVSLEWSPDNTNWNHTAKYTYTANGDMSLGASVRARYFRLVYTNGGTGQSTFRCYTFMHPTVTSHNIRPLEYTLTGQESVELTRAVLAGDTGSGYQNITATNGGNLKVSLQEASDGLDIGVGASGTETIRVALASDANVVDLGTNNDVQGAAAEGAAVSGNPFLIAGDDGTNVKHIAVAADGAVHVDDGGNSLTVDGTVSVDLNASTNTIEVVGDAAENAAVAGNPVLVGGRYDASARTLGDGDAGAIKLAADGAVQVDLNTKLDPANDEVAIAATADQTGAIEHVRLKSAATTNATVVKASAGRLYSLYVLNGNASNRFLKIYDKATTPDQNDTPKHTYVLLLNGGSPVQMNFSPGLKFANGIGYRMTANIGDTDNTAVSADDIIGVLGYK